MNPKFNSFIELADVVIVDKMQRTQVVSAALALAVSNLAHLPTTEVETATSYFNFQVCQNFTRIISEWNEGMILDAKMCLDYARMFWLVRYTAAYPLSKPMYSATYDFFDTVIGINSFVPPETMQFLDGPNKAAILSLATEAATLLVNEVMVAA